MDIDEEMRRIVCPICNEIVSDDVIFLEMMPFSETKYFKEYFHRSYTWSIRNKQIYSIGITLVEKVEGEDVLKMTFARKDKVKTLSDKF